MTTETTTHTPGPCKRAQIVKGGVFVPTSSVVQSVIVRDLITAAPGMVNALRESLAWVAKVAADADEGDPTAIAARALRFHAEVCALLRQIDEGVAANA
jgi:hypothetical protein